MKNQPSMNLIIKDKQSLWLGDFRAAKNIQLLEQYNIKTIIAITSKNLQDYPDGYTKYYFMFRDKPDSQLHKIFDQTNLIIDNSLKRNSVLVHCMAGISRSTTIVLAYLMKIKKWSFKDAYIYVKTIRPIVQPNSGFQEQLLEYQNYLSEKKPNITQSLNVTIASTEEEKLAFRLHLARKMSEFQLGFGKDNKNMSSNKKKSSIKNSYLSIYKQLEQSMKKNQLENQNLISDNKSIKNDPQKDGNQSQNSIRLKIAKKYINYNLYKNFAV